MLARNSGNATSRQRSKGLNINCTELFSPPVQLPGAASQVQGSRRSPAECSVSITGTSHGAVTREAASRPLSRAPHRFCHACTHTLGVIQTQRHTCHRHYEASADTSTYVISEESTWPDEVSKSRTSHDLTIIWNFVAGVFPLMQTLKKDCSWQVLTWGTNYSPGELTTSVWHLQHFTLTVDHTFRYRQSASGKTSTNSCFVLST